ncbi:MAG: beta-propeller domain-containing protein [Clostridiales bacterium]|nr:beta-propeller domain-containing protein [Clostridiales bacterium]
MKSNKKSEKATQKMLDEKLNREIPLPEKLSAENIEKLIYERGEIINIAQPKKHRGKTFVKFLASAVAVIAVVICGVLGFDMARNAFNLKKFDTATGNLDSDSGYFTIETAVLSRFKSYYQSYTEQRLSGLLDSMGIGGATAADSAFYSESTYESVGSSEGTASYSETNVQVTGVDEGDIIKNDGAYIYYVSESKIIITDAASMTVAAEIQEGDREINEIYLYDDKLVAVMTDYCYPDDEEEESTENAESSEYTYDCCFEYNSAAIVKIYDISDMNDITEEYTLKLSGSYVSSRVVSGKLILTANYNIPYWAVYTDQDFTSILDTCTQLTVPVYSINSGENIRIDADNILFPYEDLTEQYVIIASVSLEEPESKTYVSAIFGNGFEIYCNSEHLFVAGTYYEETSDDSSETADTVSCDATILYKFEITDEGVQYKSEGMVKGSPLNSYSMDEWNGNLRIATTVYVYDDESHVENVVTVLDEDMNVIGELDGIAADETIQSARFSEDTLYLVTYLNTDPLFVIDLSDPENPKITGELELPGFSAYLHPISDTLLVGAGSGGDTEGTDGSAKISLFDVSDPENPVEVDSYTVPNASINTDSKAFVLIDDETFAVSMVKEIYGEDSYDTYGVILVFKVIDGELGLFGSYNAYQTGGYYYNYISRAAFIDTTLYAVNVKGIIAYDMITDEKIAEVQF